MIKACIFDMDGTLVSTLDTYSKAYYAVLNDAGVAITREEVMPKFGKSAEGIISELIKDKGKNPEDYDMGGLIHQVRQRFIDHVEEVEPLPGVVDLLEEVKCKYKTAVATSSKRYAINVVLKRLNLLGYFDEIITQCDVKNGKPEPDIFLEAARKLNVGPNSCLVFEDSVFGIDAANRAGMHSVAVLTGSSSFEELKGFNPDVIVKTLADFDMAEVSKLF